MRLRRPWGIVLVVVVLAACAAPGAASKPAGGASAPGAGSAPAAAGAASPSAQAAPPPRIALKYGLNTTTVNVTPVWAAKEEGLFARHGLDVELATLPADLLVAALISGELPMTNLGTTPLINAALGGADVAFYGSFESRLRFWLYARPDITSVRDLRGKHVATTTRGGVVRRATELTLERNGMSETDVTMVATGNLNNSLTALLTGSVVAAMLAPPVSFTAEDEGMRLLVDTTDYNYPTLLAGIAANRSWVARNEDVARRVLLAIGEGVVYCIERPERAKAIMAQYTQSNDDALIERSYATYAAAWERTLVVPPDAIRLELESIAQENPAARTARPEQFFDNRLADELGRSGLLRSTN